MVKKRRMKKKDERDSGIGKKMLSEFEVIGDTVVIKFNRGSEEISGTGKSIMLASSKGFKWEEDIGVNFNVIKKKE